MLARIGAPVALLLPGRLGAMARIGLSASPQGPEPTSFPKPATIKQRNSPSCRAVCQGALAPQIDGAGGRVRRGAAIELVALEGAAAAEPCRITWAANTTREAGPNRRSRLTKQGRYDGC